MADMNGWYGSFDTFLLAAGLFVVLGWLLPWYFLRQKRKPLIGFMVSLLGGGVIMVLLGTLASWALHIRNFEGFSEALGDNVPGGILYLTETGLEFLPLGFLALLVSSVVSVIVDLRRIRQHT